MRDPMSWAVPVFRAFGILVRVHLLFFLVTLGLCGRTLYEGSYVSPADVVLFTVVLLFGIILLHEFGHCFGGRHVGGEAEDILIWPLGGLAFVSVPRNWKADAITTAAGPFVNVLICVVCAVAVTGAGYLPTLNPIHNPYACEMHNWQDGRTYTSEYGASLYAPPAETNGPPVRAKLYHGKPADMAEITALTGLDRALAPGWVVWLNRTFWLSWVLFLFNLLPAFPLDGGRLLMAFVWARSDYRRGVTVACLSGYVCGAAFITVGFVGNDTMLAMLGLFMLTASYQKLREMDAEDNPFGDFSKGYTSLDADDDPPPPRRRQGVVRRWLTARAARRIQRDLEARQRDDDRMDELLAKIGRSGKASLTDEERRFMERVSERYRR